jgi:hypothetical protein
MLLLDFEVEEVVDVTGRRARDLETLFLGRFALGRAAGLALREALFERLAAGVRFFILFLLIDLGFLLERFPAMERS